MLINEWMYKLLCRNVYKIVESNNKGQVDGKTENIVEGEDAVINEIEFSGFNLLVTHYVSLFI